MPKRTARTALHSARRFHQKLQRIDRLVGKKPNELNGNQRRTLRMAVHENWISIDKFTNVIRKNGNW